MLELTERMCPVFDIHMVDFGSVERVASRASTTQAVSPLPPSERDSQRRRRNAGPNRTVDEAVIQPNGARRARPVAGAFASLAPSTPDWRNYVRVWDG